MPALYAHLLKPDQQSEGATISGAPVNYNVKQQEDEEAQKKKDGIVPRLVILLEGN